MRTDSETPMTGEQETQKVKQVELRVDAQKNLAVSESNLICCKIRHRSVHARVLHGWGVPSCCLALWHVVENIRWLFSWCINYQPLGPATRSATPDKNCCHRWFLSVFGLMNVLDLITWAVFIATTIVTGLVFIAGLFGDRKILYDESEGWGSLATIGFAFTWVLGPRNSIFNIFLNLPFERALKYHRWIGRFSVWLLCLHWLGFWIYWLDRKKFGDAWSNSNLMGFVSTCAALGILFTSFNVCRRKIFEVFLKLHWILFLIFLFAGALHEGDVLGTMGFPIFLWCLDLLWRWYISCNSNRQVVIHDMAILPGNVIKIEFSKLNFVYEAGQYVFVCIPQLALTEWHPFSISSCPQDDRVTLHIRVLGDWTSKLYDFVEQRTTSNEGFDNIQCWMDGPYGSLTVPIHNYEHIVLISGGIGITPMQSIFNDMIHELRSGEHNVDRIHFVWTVRDPEMIREATAQHWSAIKRRDDIVRMSSDAQIPPWFSPNLLQVWDGSSTTTCEVLTSFYVTRCDDEEKARLDAQYPNLLHFGRPSIEDILVEAKNKAGGKNVVVMSCGPVGLVEMVRSFALKHNIACHVEVFDF